MANNVGAIIVAAGGSERMGGVDKIFAEVAGKPLLAHTLAVFQASRLIDTIVVVLSADNVERGQAIVEGPGLSKVSAVCMGGPRRQDSVRLGLTVLRECDFVAVHDGGRPLVTEELIARGLETARDARAAAPAVPVRDTIKEAGPDRVVVRTLPRERLWAVQTPQVFRYELLERAHQEITGDVTDDAAMVEALGMPVKLFEGDPRNLKVTTVEDLRVVKALVGTGGSRK